MEGFPQSDPHTRDEVLASLLNDGTGMEFARTRNHALETLETSDVLAFRVLAVGDGTPLDAAPAGATPSGSFHQISQLAGYHDGLPPERTSNLARHLFGHHLGTLARPDPTTASPADTIERVGADVSAFAGHLYEDSTGASVRDPSQVALSTRLEQAGRLLTDPSLTLFWMQVLTDDGVVRSTGSEPTADRSSGERDTVFDYSVNSVLGVPDRLPSLYRTTILSQLFAQHALLGSAIAGVDVDTFCEEAVSTALDAGYHEDVAGA